MMRVLEDEGVDIIFGFPGGAVIDIYDEMVKSEKIKHILVRHEQGAVHAADGLCKGGRKTWSVSCDIRDRVQQIQ